MDENKQKGTRRADVIVVPKEKRDSDDGEPQAEVEHRSLGPKIEQYAEGLEAQMRNDRELGG